MASNWTVSRRLLMGWTTSSPLCLAAQVRMSRVPQMKSFWTSMTSSAVTGFTIWKVPIHHPPIRNQRLTVLIQWFQQKANSSRSISPSRFRSKISKISFSQLSFTVYELPLASRNRALHNSLNSP